MDSVIPPEVWPIGPVDENPEVYLIEWQVFEVTMPRKGYRTRHFVGWSVRDRAGQVSSEIVSFDPSTRRGVTSSGRVYELGVKPGWNVDAEHTWKNWLRINEVSEALDVTASLRRLG